MQVGTHLTLVSMEHIAPECNYYFSNNRSVLAFQSELLAGLLTFVSRQVSCIYCSAKVGVMRGLTMSYFLILHWKIYKVYKIAINCRGTPLVVVGEQMYIHHVKSPARSRSKTSTISVPSAVYLLPLRK